MDVELVVPSRQVNPWKRKKEEMQIGCCSAFLFVICVWRKKLEGSRPRHVLGAFCSSWCIHSFSTTFFSSSRENCIWPKKGNHLRILGFSRFFHLFSPSQWGFALTFTIYSNFRLYLARAFFAKAPLFTVNKSGKMMLQQKLKRTILTSYKSWHLAEGVLRKS